MIWPVRQWLSGLVAASILLGGAARAGEPYPSATIENEEISMRMYLPDDERGYYRGVRFDRSGLIDAVEWRGVRFFGDWQARHDPLASDAVVGPAEEFGMTDPPGFADAKVGEGFLKIGVGVLEKPDDAKYDFPRSYKVLRAEPWALERGDSGITFRHHADAGRGYAYEYEKTVSLNAKPPGFTIAHRLKNTGSKRWVTDQYCHNLVVFNNEVIGPEVTVTLPFAPKPVSAGKLAKIEGDTVTFPAKLPVDGSAWAVLEGGAGTVAENAGTFTNHKLGARLRFQGDRKAEKLVLYAQNKAVCLEPYIALDLEPGEEVRWTTRYFLEDAEAAR